MHKYFLEMHMFLSSIFSGLYDTCFILFGINPWALVNCNIYHGKEGKSLRPKNQFVFLHIIVALNLHLVNLLASIRDGW